MYQNLVDIVFWILEKLSPKSAILYIVNFLHLSVKFQIPINADIFNGQFQNLIFLTKQLHNVKIKKIEDYHYHNVHNVSDSSRKWLLLAYGGKKVT